MRVYLPPVYVHYYYHYYNARQHVTLQTEEEEHSGVLSVAKV